MNVKNFGFVFVVFMLFLGVDGYAFNPSENGYSPVSGTSTCRVTLEKIIMLPALPDITGVSSNSDDVKSIKTTNKQLSAGEFMCVSDYENVDDAPKKYSYYCEEIPKKMLWVIPYSEYKLYRKTCVSGCNDGVCAGEDIDDFVDSITIPKTEVAGKSQILKNGVVYKHAYSSTGAFRTDNSVLIYNPTYVESLVDDEVTNPSSYVQSEEINVNGYACVYGLKITQYNVATDPEVVGGVWSSYWYGTVSRTVLGRTTEKEWLYYRDCASGCNDDTGRCNGDPSIAVPIRDDDINIPNDGVNIPDNSVVDVPVVISNDGAEGSEGANDPETTEDIGDGGSETPNINSNLLVTYNNNQNLFMSSDKACSFTGYECESKSGTGRQSWLSYCESGMKYYRSCPTDNCVPGVSGGCEMIKNNQDKPIITVSGNKITAMGTSGMDQIAYNVYDGEKFEGWNWIYCNGDEDCVDEIPNDGVFTLVQAKAINGMWAKELSVILNK